MDDVIDLPEQYWPKVEELPGELRRIAGAIDPYFPGQGVRITLILAQVFPGHNLYFRQVKHIIRQWRDDSMRNAYDQGDVTVKELARLYRMSERNTEKILARPHSQAVLEKKQGRLF